MGLAVSVPSCPREQLRSLSRAELEGRLENALVIIEVLVLQLRNWQESQRSLPSVGPAKQRDAPAQTDITWSQGVSGELRVEENWGLVPLQLCYRADEFAVFEPFPWLKLRQAHGGGMSWSRGSLWHGVCGEMRRFRGAEPAVAPL